MQYVLDLLPACAGDRMIAAEEVELARLGVTILLWPTSDGKLLHLTRRIISQRLFHAALQLVMLINQPTYTSPSSVTCPGGEGGGEKE